METSVVRDRLLGVSSHTLTIISAFIALTTFADRTVYLNWLVCSSLMAWVSAWMAAVLFLETERFPRRRWWFVGLIGVNAVILLDVGSRICLILSQIQ